MTFRLSLAERRRASDWQREKYWRDPDYRLRRINKARKRLGLPPHEHIIDAATRGPND